MKIKKVIICILLLIFIVSLSLIGCENKKTDTPLNEEQKQRLEEWMENRSSNNNKLIIQEDWTITHEELYSYIRGRVKNETGKNIKYFEVIANFKDEDGNVLDGGYTNDGLVLRPDEMREFEIMHKYNDEYKSVSLGIGEIKH